MKKYIFGFLGTFSGLFLVLLLFININDIFLLLYLVFLVGVLSFILHFFLWLLSSPFKPVLNLLISFPRSLLFVLLNILLVNNVDTLVFSSTGRYLVPLIGFLPIKLLSELLSFLLFIVIIGLLSRPNLHFRRITRPDPHD